MILIIGIARFLSVFKEFNKAMKWIKENMTIFIKKWHIHVISNNEARFACPWNAQLCQDVTNIIVILFLETAVDMT